MKLYTARSTIKNREACQRLGIGLMMVDGWTDPSPYPYFAIDNGCYSAWSRGVPWDPAPFMHNLHKCRELGLKPDFAVIPDIVAGGAKSLTKSRKWLNVLRDEFPGIPLYLAVQDGMEVSDLSFGNADIDGIFVGGSTAWKLRTMAYWAQFAHEMDLRIHVGRIGTPKRMVAAHKARVDSIDSTTWVQRNGALEHHVAEYIERANMGTLEAWL